MNLNPRDNRIEFNRFIFRDLDLNLYKYKYLNYYLNETRFGRMSLYDSSVLNVTESGWILILHGESLLVYGENWNNFQIEEISTVFNLNKFTNYSLAGDEALIDCLIDFFQPANVETEKRRTFYIADEINYEIPDGIQIQLATIDRQEELAVMLQEYYHYEYSGQNNKSIEEMRFRVQNLVESRDVYILLESDLSIVSFCTVINPDIGILFTNERYRNNGYGKMILSFCSNQLLNINNEVFAMTDSSRLASNRVCESIGFRPYFHYVMKNINSSTR